MEPFIGQIQLFGFNFAPRGWALCEGQLLPISQWTALFSLLGTTFGGDGETTFALPDLRGRSPVGVGSGPGLDTITWGVRAGNYQKTLTVSNMPSHNHISNMDVNTANGEESNPQNNVIAAHAAAFAEDPSSGAKLNNSAVSSNTGGGQAFNLRNPFLGLYYSIALTGVYPSRN